MTDLRLSFTWEAYQKNMCNGLGLLQQRGEFVDMTLAADGHHVKVHQMVLSLVSPFIKELIASAQCPHPVIFLNRVSYQTLQLILEYVYTGEVVVPRDMLDDFLQACRALSIKGLESETTSSADQATLPERVIPEPLSTPMPNIGQIIQIGTKRKRTNNSIEVDGDDTTQENMLRIDDSQMEDCDFDGGIDEDEATVPKRNADDSQPELKLIAPETPVQFSISCQGSIHLILNRYIYHMRHTRKNNEKTWRCADYNKTACSAFVVTKDSKIVERGCAHNHSFHDKRILKKARSGNIFTAFKTAETMVSMKKKLPTT